MAKLLAKELHSSDAEVIFIFLDGAGEHFKANVQKTKGSVGSVPSSRGGGCKMGSLYLHELILSNTLKKHLMFLENTCGAMIFPE